MAPGEHIVHVTLPPLTVASTNDFSVSLDPEEIGGLLRPFSARAQVILVALLRGHTETMAAASAGVSPQAVFNWKAKYPEFREACAQAAAWGFGAVFEAELHTRAVAGKSDPGSMRALELVVKSRDDAYREKRESNVTVFNVKDSATLGGVLGVWQGRRTIEGEATPVDNPSPSDTVPPIDDTTPTA